MCLYLTLELDIIFMFFLYIHLFACRSVQLIYSVISGWFLLSGRCERADMTLGIANIKDTGSVLFSFGEI